MSNKYLCTSLNVKFLFFFSAICCPCEQVKVDDKIRRSADIWYWQKIIIKLSTLRNFLKKYVLVYNHLIIIKRLFSPVRNLRKIRSAWSFFIEINLFTDLCHWLCIRYKIYANKHHKQHFLFFICIHILYINSIFLLSLLPLCSLCCGHILYSIW